MDCKPGVVTRSIQTAASTLNHEATRVEPSSIAFININTGKLHGWGTRGPPEWDGKSTQELFSKHLCVFGILMQPYMDAVSRCVGVSQMANVNISSTNRHYLSDLVLGKEIWIGERISDTRLTFKLCTAPLPTNDNFPFFYGTTRVGMVLRRIANSVGKTTSLYVLCRCNGTFNDINHIDKRTRIEEEDQSDSASSADSASGLFSSSADTTGQNSSPSEDGW